MSFYQSIAQQYDSIFPLNQQQVNFVLNTIPKGDTSHHLLDIGCGTGKLSNILSSYNMQVTGIDLDETMLEIAKKFSNEKLHFKQVNMLEMSKQYPPNHFNTILCLGNTLVHLNSEQEIGECLKQCRTLLQEKGSLVIQIINYDRILNNDIKALPTIENELVKFERKYIYKAELRRIDFNTILTLKKENKQLTNTQLLYPIRKNELENVLSAAGFSSFEYFGNFNGDKLTESSIPLIVICN